MIQTYDHFPDIEYTTLDKVNVKNNINYISERVKDKLIELLYAEKFEEESFIRVKPEIESMIRSVQTELGCSGFDIDYYDFDPDQQYIKWKLVLYYEKRDDFEIVTIDIDLEFGV